MKKSARYMIFWLGVLCLLAAALFYGLDQFELVSLANSRQPMGLFATGILYVLCGFFESSSTKSKLAQIEEKDERNVAMRNRAKAFGFDIMLFFLLFLIVQMYIYDYLSVIQFSVLAGACLSIVLAYRLRLYYLKKEM